MFSSVINLHILKVSVFSLTWLRVHQNDIGLFQIVFFTTTTMTPYQTRAVYGMLPELTAYVNADDITGRLLSNKAISMHDLDRIDSCSARYDKMTLLVKIILHPDSPPGQPPYQALLNALGDNYLTLAEQIAQKCQQYEEGHNTVVEMKDTCRKLADGCGINHDSDLERFADCCYHSEKHRKKIRLESDYSVAVQSDRQQVAEEAISPRPCTSGRTTEQENSIQDGLFVRSGDICLESRDALVPSSKRQVWYGALFQRRGDMKQLYLQTSLPATLSSSVDFPSKKMARFVYQLQRQMGDFLDHCAWDQLDSCAEQVSNRLMQLWHISFFTTKVKPGFGKTAL